MVLKKQPIVTLSTTEAEYVAVATCACQAIWMKRILKEIGHEQDEEIVLFCDNTSTIKLSKNAVMHGKSKHIRVRYHFLRELTKESFVKLVYYSTEEQLADIMTKPLKMTSFQRIREAFGMTFLNLTLDRVQFKGGSVESVLDYFNKDPFSRFRTGKFLLAIFLLVV